MNQPQPKRGRPPKSQPPTDPNENESSYSDNASVVETVIEEHRESAGLDILAQATQALEAPKLSKGQRYKANLKARKTAQADDFQTIIATLLTLVVSAWSAPEGLKPNEDEVNAFSVPATRMLLRHVPIASKLSQDALDIIGMVGAISSYYARTSDAWRSYRLAQAENRRQKAEEEAKASYTLSPMADDPLNILARRHVDDNAEAQL